MGTTPERLRSMTIEDYVRMRVEIIEEGGCWEWHGASNGKGFPMMWWRGKILAVRRALMKIPKGKYAQMSCKNEKCVCPDHIKVVEKATYLRGRKMTAIALMNLTRGRRRASNTKLTIEKAREIRRRLNEGEKAVTLAIEVGVDKETVSQIKRGLIWRETTPFSI